MLNFIFKTTNFTEKLAKQIVKETDKVLIEHSQDQMKEFNEIKEILAHLHDKISQLELRLSSKELKDRNDYGHIQYKIGEIQSNIKKL